MRLKYCISIILFCSMLLSFSGCSKELPKNFPDMSQDSNLNFDASNSNDITSVNFYFDNIENTHAIDYTSTINSSFIQALISTNRSTFSTTDFQLELHGDDYSISKCDKPIEDLYRTDDFYISSSTKKSRENSGVINLLFDEENPQINMNEVNVIFTDLSEPHIDKAARIIHDNYLSSEEYNVCLLTIEMQPKKDYKPFFIYSSNNTVIEVNAKGLDKRFYHLLILGPTTKVAAYVHCLKANLKDARPIENSDYFITDYDYVQHTFDIEEDINYDSILYPNANIAYLASIEEIKVESAEDKDTPDNPTITSEIPTISYNDRNDEVFRTNLIRLISKDDYYKHQVWHLEYDKKYTNDLYLSPKGYGSNSYDFSLQANLDFYNVLENKIPHYISLKKKNDGSIIYNDIPNVEMITKDDIFFSFGAEEEIMFYTDTNGDWERLDEKRVARFFKSCTTNDGRLNIISDNTDEGGIKNLYIVVPVYQIVIKKNYTLSWIDKRAYIPGQESNALERYEKTFDLRQFYSLLFGINIENREGNYFVDETIMERNIMGYARILITGI